MPVGASFPAALWGLSPVLVLGVRVVAMAIVVVVDLAWIRASGQGSFP